jgi:putative transposase
MNQKKYNRKSIRKKGFDYLQEGLYFLTICCKDMKCCFGEVVNGEMKWNAAGKIANECWLAIPTHFPHAILHEFVVMPNHVHGIIELMSLPVGANNHSPQPNNHSPQPNNHSPQMSDMNNHSPQPNNHSPQPDGIENMANGFLPYSGAKNFSPLRSPSKTIGSIVRGFKIGVTKWMRQNTDVHDVWQRNYYDIIIRNDLSYHRISNYIINNPKKWSEDKFHSKKN